MSKNFKICILESPYRGDTPTDTEDNMVYAQKCMHDMLLRGEAPYASHLLYTQPNVLDDSVPEERELGIYAGFAYKHLDVMHSVFYTDRGMSLGMDLALEYCREHNMSYEFRSLEEEKMYGQ